jgi:hypothetical protein
MAKNTWSWDASPGTQSGRLRTLYSLSKRGLVRYVKNGETIVADGQEYSVKVPGWVVTEEGRKVLDGV